MDSKYHKDSRDAGGRESNGGGGGGGGMVALSIQVDSTREYHYHGGGGGGGLGSGGAGGSGSFNHPRPDPTPGSGGSRSRHGKRSPSTGREQPEKRLTLFALRLAVLEKAASGLGKLAFVWATVVLLGGFAGSLTITDFWCVTVILVGEGARVFSRSHELEWQHRATTRSSSAAASALRSSSRFFHSVVHALVPGPGPGATTADGALRSGARRFRRTVHALVDPAAAGVGGGGSATLAQVQSQITAATKQRTWHPPDVALLPYTRRVFVSKNIGRLLNWLQVLSAVACVALSVLRLWKHDFVSGGGSVPGNMRPALLLFYTLAFLEAMLFLLEKAYWTFSFHRLLRQVNNECLLGDYWFESLTRFFYDAYSRCLAGSIFDGVKMDLVTFSEELILSDFLHEQLIGVRILQQFATSAASAGDTLRKVGTSAVSIERLVEMLNWKRPEVKVVRLSAAKVVSKLAGKRQNALRVSGIPGALESIMSLLYTDWSALVPGPGGGADEHDDYLPFNLLGLLILKKLARDHENCGKIGNARGLLAKIIQFTQASPVLLAVPHESESSPLRAVKRALQVMKMLVSTTGNTGKELRQAVAENVFTVSNLRTILRYGKLHREHQTLAIRVLTGLSMDKKGKEAILSTGGLVELLLSVLMAAREDKALGCEAGEALAMLALESERGCAAILKGDDVLDRLMSVLEERDARLLNAARLLRNLCAYSGEEEKRGRARLRGASATRALPAVLRATMEEDGRILEVSVGLTTEICRRFTDGEQFGAALRAAGVVDERWYVERLATILKEHSYPDVKVPRMRRFVVQQVIWLMTCDGGARMRTVLREVGMVERLRRVADTTSELECFHVFSGSVGIGNHRESLSGIVETAIELLAGHSDQARAED